MASIGPIEVRIRDSQHAQLFVYELESLRDDMRVAASPFAERLERALERFAHGDDESGGEFGSVDVVVEETVYEPCPNCGHAGIGLRLGT